MSKSDDADLKHLASEASQAIGPLKKMSEDAFKTCGLMAKNPNPKQAEMLADQVEGLIGQLSELKSVLKELKAVS